MSHFNFLNGKARLLFVLFSLVMGIETWAQDEPCTAIDLPVGMSCSTVLGSNLTATNSPGITAPGCGDYQGSDVWYTVTLPNNGLQAVIELTGLGLFDGAIGVYAGDDCGSLSLVDCDDNSLGGTNAQIRIDDGCTFENIGKTYWVRVWEAGNDANGAFNICAYADEAPIVGNPMSCNGNLLSGDACCEAILLANDELDGYCGTTDGYSPIPPNPTDGTFPIPEFGALHENNAWLAFIPSSTHVALEITSYGCDFGQGIQAAILTTDDCIDFSATSTGIFSTMAEGSYLFEANDFVVGKVYYMNIDGWGGDNCSYDINVIDGIANTSVTASDTTLCLGESTKLQAIAIGNGPYTYQWSNPGDLDDPTILNPTATPTTTTTYVVTIDSPNGTLVDSVTIIIVPETPTATMIIGEDNHCNNTTGVTYTVDSPRATDFLWTLTGGDGVIVSATDQNNVTIDWGTTGGQLCVDVSNTCGNGPQDCLSITNSPPTSVTAMDPAVICAPQAMDLSTIPLNITGAVGAVSYHATQADADTGWPIINPPVVDTTGTYWVRVQTGTNCYDLAPIFVDIQYVDVEIRSPLPACEPATYDLDQLVVTENGWNPGTKTFYPDSLDAVNSNNPMTNTVVAQGGTYWLRYETQYGCFEVEPIYIIIERLPQITITQHPIICPGSDVDLAATTFVDANSATIVSSLYYDNFSFAQLDITSLALTNTVVNTAGDYFWRVETALGCNQIVTITVTETIAPVGQISTSGPVCPGDQAELFFDLNGVGPFNVTYSDGTSNTTLTGIMDGATEIVTVNSNTTYSIISFTDQTGCSGNIVGAPAQVDVHTPPTATLNGDNTLCGDGTTDLTFNFTGNGPFDIVYSNGSDISLTGITDGHTESVNITQNDNFTLISVIDNNGCSGTISGSADITHYETLQVINIDETCDVGVTGYTVQFEIIGGDAATYSVGGAGTLSGNIFTSDLIANNVAYNFTVSDNSGCPSVMISGVKNCACATEAGTMDLSNTIEVCQGEMISVANLHNNDEVLVGTDVLMFVLHNNAGTTLGGISEINATGNFNFLPGMTPGATYYISAIAGPADGSGGIDLGHICTTISQGIPVVFHAIPEGSISGLESICRGDNAIITFNFTSGTPPFDVVYTDGTNNYTIENIADGATAAVSPIVNTIFSILSITDNTGADCSNTGNGVAEVNILESPFAENIVATCNNTNTEYQIRFNITSGDPTTYVVSGAGNYDAATNTFTSDFIPSGTPYSFTVNDANNCSPMLVEGNHVCDCTTATVDMDDDLLALCDGTTAIATYTGTPVLDGNDAFAFVLHDGSGTQLGNVLFVNTIPEFSYNSMLSYGTTYYISAIAGDDDGTGVPIIDRTANPCLAIAAGQPVIFTPIPTIDILGDTTICAGDTHELTFILGGIGPFDVAYTDGVGSFNLDGIDNGHTVTINPLDTTVYTLISVQTTNIPNCTGNVFNGNNAVTVNVIEKPEIINVISTCNDEGIFYTISFDIIGGNAMFYQVNGSSGTLTGTSFISDPIISGTSYIFEVTDGTNCLPVIITDEVRCKCTPDILPTIASEESISCPGGNDAGLSVRPNNGIAPYSYVWSTGETGEMVTDLPTGWYHVTMTDGNDCISQDSFFLVEPDSITTDFMVTDATCFGENDGRVEFFDSNGGAGDYLYELDVRASYIGKEFFGLEAGTYVAKITDGNGCVAEDTVVVDQPEELLVDLGPDQILTYGDSIELVAGFNQAVSEFVWSSSSSVSAPDTNQYFAYVRPWQTTTYILDGVNEFGCTGTGDVTINIEKTLPVYIPNAFSPNGDGENDKFTVHTGLGVKEIVSFQIFSRWGAQLYAAYNLDPVRENFGWDGRVKGRTISSGVYIYSLEVLFDDGTRELFSGDVTMLR